MGAPTSQLIGAALFSEASKSVVFSAFNLHLLGINARIMAAKLGTQGQAFGVLSAEWVKLGHLFETSMRELEALNERIVRTISHSMIGRKRRALLGECQADLERFGSLRLSTTKHPEPADLATRQALRKVIDEALRGCTLGRVITSAAKIEAAWHPTSRQLLDALASDFESQLTAILPPLRALDALEREGLS
jgi:hypothetical protein